MSYWPFTWIIFRYALKTQRHKAASERGKTTAKQSIHREMQNNHKNPPQAQKACSPMPKQYAVEDFFCMLYVCLYL